VYLNGQVLRVDLGGSGVYLKMPFWNANRHVLTDNLNGPNARLNARLQNF
jgi:hypothetical protein